MLGVYGFLFGAMIASSIMGVSNTIGMIVAALVGGIVGAIILIVAYFVGVALVGAGLGTLAAHSSWTALQPGDPPWQLVILASVIGAIVAIILQRYVIIVGTAFGGAGRSSSAPSRSPTAAPCVLRHRRTRGSSSSEPGARRAMDLIVWVVLGLVGTAVAAVEKEVEVQEASVDVVAC